jgi:hypothetical protein
MVQMLTIFVTWNFLSVIHKNVQYIIVSELVSLLGCLLFLISETKNIIQLVEIVIKMEHMSYG